MLLTLVPSLCLSVFVAKSSLHKDSNHEGSQSKYTMNQTRIQLFALI